MSDVSLSVGSVISFQYPAANFSVVRRKRYESRRLLIQAVRDTAVEPLDPVTTELEPLLQRGRILVTGLDLDKGAERSFYTDSMSELRLLTEAEYLDLRDHVVELHEPECSPEVVYVGPADAAIASVREWLKNPLGLTIAVVPPRVVA